MALSVECTSFAQGGLVPEEYAFGVLRADGAVPEGGNRNPHLRWSGAPEGTRSYAVLVVDPDAPVDTSDAGAEGTTIAADRERGDFAHLVLVDLPPTVTELPEGSLSDRVTPGGRAPGPSPVGGVTGINDYTQFFASEPTLRGTYGGYDGPFPPPNDERVHRYFFTVLALDVATLGLGEEFGLAEARQAMEGHVLASGEWRGVYTLRRELRDRMEQQP